MSGIADISRLASSRMVVSLGSQKRESSSGSWSIGREWVTIIGSGLPKAGSYCEIINTDAETYGPRILGIDPLAVADHAGVEARRVSRYPASEDDY